MGKKIENVKRKGQEGGEIFKGAEQLGKEAVSEIKKMKHLVDSLPTDVDDEIAAATKAVEQGSKKEAEDYMKAEVNSKVEAGKKTLEKANNEAKEQIKNNEAVKNIYKQMDSVGGFGKAARAEGTGKIEKSTKEFNAEIAKNAEAARQAESEFNKKLSDISSTF